MIPHPESEAADSLGEVAQRPILRWHRGSLRQPQQHQLCHHGAMPNGHVELGLGVHIACNDAPPELGVYDYPNLYPNPIL